MDGNAAGPWRPTRPAAAVEYGDDWEPRRVDANGKLYWRGDRVFLSHALEGQTVGLRDLRADAVADAVADAGGAGRYFAVRFVTVELGVLDARRGRMLRPRERRHLAFPQ